MRICNVASIKPDASLPKGFWQVGYGMKEGIEVIVFGLMAFRAESFEDAKAKFFEYTKDQCDGYNWPEVTH